jgi:hypothetical protein
MAIIVSSAQSLYAPEQCQPQCAVSVPCVTECLVVNRPVKQVCLDEFTKALKSYGTFKEGTERLAAPDNALIEQVVYSLQDFTRHSMVLRRRASMVTVEGKRDYDIVPMPNEQIHRIESICVNGQCVPFKDGECCVMCEYGITGWSFEQPAKIVFDKIDCAGLKIEVKYIAESAHDACMIDELVMKRYKEAVLYGSISRLLTIPSWEWAAPNYGLNAQRKYDKLLAEAKIDMWRKFSRHAHQAVQPRGRVY